MPKPLSQNSYMKPLLGMDNILTLPLTYTTVYYGCLNSHLTQMDNTCTLDEPLGMQSQLVDVS